MAVDQLDARRDALVVALPVARAVRLWPRLERALDAELFGADFEKTRFSIVLAFDRPLDVGFRVAWPKNSPLTLLYDDSSRSAATAAAPAASVWVGQSDTAWAAARLKQPAAATAAERSQSSRGSWARRRRRSGRARLVGRTVDLRRRGELRERGRLRGRPEHPSRVRGRLVLQRPRRGRVAERPRRGQRGASFSVKQRWGGSITGAVRRQAAPPCELRDTQMEDRRRCARLRRCSTQHAARGTCHMSHLREKIRFAPWPAGCFFLVVGRW